MQRMGSYGSVLFLQRLLKGCVSYDFIYLLLFSRIAVGERSGTDRTR